MKKEEVLKNIRAARRSHVMWVDRARSLVNGFPVNKEQIPLEVTSCDFGQWFYCDGQILLVIFSEESIKKLENKHRELHDSYMKIFKIYFDTSNQSFIAKLLKRRKKISDRERHLALEDLQKLEKVSDELVSYLNIIEKRMNQIDESRFEKFI